MATNRWSRWKSQGGYKSQSKARLSGTAVGGFTLTVDDPPQQIFLPTVRVPPK